MTIKGGIDLKGLPNKHFMMLKRAGHYPADIVKKWSDFIKAYGVTEHEYPYIANDFAQRMLAVKNDLMPSKEWHPLGATLARLNEIGIPPRHLVKEQVDLLIEWWNSDLQVNNVLPVYFDQHFFNFVVHQTTISILEYAAVIARSVERYEGTLPEGEEVKRELYEGFINRIDDDGHRFFTLIQWYEYTLGFLSPLGFQNAHIVIVGPPTYERVNSTSDKRAWPSAVTSAMEQGVLDSVKYYGQNNTPEKNRDWYYQSLDQLEYEIEAVKNF